MVITEENKPNIINQKNEAKLILKRELNNTPKY